MFDLKLKVYQVERTGRRPPRTRTAARKRSARGADRRGRAGAHLSRRRRRSALRVARRTTQSSGRSGGRRLEGERPPCACDPLVDVALTWTLARPDRPVPGVVRRSSAAWFGFAGGRTGLQPGGACPAIRRGGIVHRRGSEVRIAERLVRRHRGCWRRTSAMVSCSTQARPGAARRDLSALLPRSGCRRVVDLDVVEDEAGARTPFAGGVARVEDVAGPQRQAAAADAAVEPVAKALEHGDLRVEAGPPRAGQAVPVALVGVRPSGSERAPPGSRRGAGRPAGRRGRTTPGGWRRARSGAGRLRCDRRG